MMTMREDVHAPSAIVPEDYEYVAQECIKIQGLGDCYALMHEREKITAHMKRTGGTYSSHQHGGNCMVCGSINAIYTALFYHAKTNTYVRMGQDCAEKCDMGDPDAFKAFKAGIDDARQLHKGKAKAQALLSDQGLARAWVVYVEALRVGPFVCLKEEQTIFDIVGKLISYGSLSDKQFEFLKGLIDRIDTRASRMAQREQERASAKPCPSGRIDITGTVLSVKEHASDFGPTLKMTVKADDGWVCYGTVPSTLALFQDGDIQRGLKHGDRVTFTAALTPSPTDPKFGFFKRPTCAKIVS